MAMRKPATVVTELLGVRALARHLGLTPGAVSKWKNTGLVPSKHHEKILDFAKARRKRLAALTIVRGKPA